MLRMRDKYKILFVIAGLTTAVLAVFWQVRGFEFVNYDDDKYVSKNEHILSGLTIENVAWVFTSEHCGNWHPITGLSHILDCEFFGANPGRHHLVSLMFHLVNTLLIFVILRRMTGALWASAFVAAVFGLHPLHVESVAWISERKDVLSTLFWLLATAAYFRYVRRPSIGHYIMTLVFFALGLMAKPMLVTLPFVFLLLDYWPLGRLKNGRQIYHLIWEKIPFFVLSAISSVITFTFQKGAGAVVGIQFFPLTGRIANAVVSYAGYIGKIIWPVNLAVFYPYLGHEPAVWQVFVAAALLLTMTIVVIRLGGKYRYLPVGWFWYLGTLVPVIGLMQTGEQSMADRYTYIPLTGLSIAVAWGVNDLAAKWNYRKIALWILSFIIILILTVSARFQAGYWRDSMTLFSRAIRTTGGNYLAYYGIGTVYFDKGAYDAAVAAYTDAIKINSRYVAAYNNRGTAYSQGKGAYDLAISDFNEALEISPRFAAAYYNRANAYAEGKGAYDQAISDYSKAIELNPQYTAAYNNRGNTYAVKGAFDLAISDYSKVIEINPRDAEAYANRGNAYKSRGKYDLAISDYNKVLAIIPRDARACFSKAGAYDEAGRKKEAIEAYKEFIRYAPAQYAPYVEQVRQRIRQLEQ